MQRQLTWCLYPAAIPLCLWLSLPLAAQDCRIAGRITDAGRTAVATAIITATQVDSGAKRQVLSNAQGYFQLAPLSAGQYRIEAAKPGFKPLSPRAVSLSPGSAATVDLQMENTQASEPVALEVRRLNAGFLLAYICGLSTGSGCETLAPEDPASMFDAAVIKAYLP
jgi:hypothetical protein